MNKDEIKVPHKGARTTFQGTPCFAQERLAFDVGYREGYYDAVSQQSKISSNTLLADRLPTTEDVKRWYQLLVGKSEIEMQKDIEATLR